MGAIRLTYHNSNLIASSSLELVNHLNNILSVISDKVIPHPSGGSVAYYKADILQAQDFSPFGVKLKGRNLNKTGNTELYRSGFQGQEEDDELKGDGNSVNFEFRMHDPRLGRFFAIDPLTRKYPWYTPYSYSGNKVIAFIELEGAEELSAIQSNIHAGKGKIVFTIGSDVADPVNIGASKTASEEGSEFDYIHGETIQDVETQLLKYMSDFGLENLSTIVFHQHGGTGAIGVKSIAYQYDNINDPKGTKFVMVQPGQNGSLKEFGGKEYTGSNTTIYEGINSFINVLNQIGPNGDIVFVSCAIAAEDKAHESDYDGQFSKTIGEFTGNRANVYTCEYLATAVKDKSLLNRPLSYGSSDFVTDEEIGWYKQNSESNGGTLEKLPLKSLQISGNGTVTNVDSPLHKK